MRIHLSLYLSFMLVTSFLAAQNSIPVSWDQLGDIRFEEAYDEEMEEKYDRPIFGPSVQMLEGSDVKLTGYVIPMDITANLYAVSRFPFSSCFFCGNAGPETVIVLEMSDDSHTFKNDDRRTFCGRLKLNSGNFGELPYTLENVELCP